MSGQNIYLLTYLPAPGNLGDQAPLSCRQFLSILSEDDGMICSGELARAIMLSDDLLLRDACLGGEIDINNENDPKISHPVVLDILQMTDEEPLPEYILPQDDAATANIKIPADNVWESYFRYVDAMGRKYNSKFTIAWVGFEVALRNAVAEERAKVLELEPSDYFVAEDLADAQTDFTTAVNEWSVAANPMEGQRALDQARWEWLNQNDAFFSFDDDELVSYAAKLLLMKRWGRLTELMETTK